MKNLLLSILFIGLLNSCYHEVRNKVSVPDRLLSEDSLVMVLTEIQIAEGALTYKRISHIKTTDEKERYYALIYQKYNLSPELVKQNINYYNSNADQMISIYDKVLEHLSKLEGDLTIQKKLEEKAKEDSLKSIDTTIYIRSSLLPAEKDSLEKELPWHINN